MTIPKSLKWIADHIGDDAVNRILLQFSGERLYIPSARHLDEDHRLVGILGWDIAVKLCQLVQIDENKGDRLELAYRYTPEHRSKRADVIKRMKAQGFTNQDISLAFNLCPHQVRKISNSKVRLSVKAKRVHYEGQLSLL
jgi:hypothetical protein